MTQTTTYITDASIGTVAFQQPDLDAFEFTYEDWLGLALSLFDDLVPDDVEWLPHQSEIVGPAGVYDADEEDEFLTVARNAMLEAFEQLATQ